MSTIPEFGDPEPGVAYLIRPGGYAIIFNDSGEVATVSTPGGLALPGGGQDQGESPEDAAVRECREECGLRIVVGQLIGVADDLTYAADYQQHFRKRCAYFFAEVVGRTDATEPDHELRWHAADAALPTLHLGGQRWALREALRLRTV